MCSFQQIQSIEKPCSSQRVIFKERWFSLFVPEFRDELNRASNVQSHSFLIRVFQAHIAACQSIS